MDFEHSHEWPPSAREQRQASDEERKQITDVLANYYIHRAEKAGISCRFPKGCGGDFVNEIWIAHLAGGNEKDIFEHIRKWAKYEYRWLSTPRFGDVSELGKAQADAENKNNTDDDEKIDGSDIAQLFSAFFDIY